MGNNVLLGRDAVKYIGSKAQRLANPDLKWEESEQTDFGIDLGFFNNALTVSADYYIKKTNGMIMEMPIPSYVGESKPLGTWVTWKIAALSLRLATSGIFRMLNLLSRVMPLILKYIEELR